MSLEKITEVRGQAVYVPGEDVDTDRIIPARFMKCVTFDGLGEYAFFDERFTADGTPKKHPLNDPRFKQASILISGRNFGCGSSREHAPQSLYHYGFRAVIAETFAEIFFGNSTTLGMPCMTLETASIRRLGALVEANPAVELVLDVARCEVRCGGEVFKAQLAESARQGLIEGRWDPIADLLEGGQAIEQTASSLAYVGKA